MEFLQGIGSHKICQVCIAHGGSCCSGCKFLNDGEGCQKRNTSCTAWLCGFLKFLLYQTGMLSAWYDFWIQVPGKDYRVDSTPDYFTIKNWIKRPNIQELSEALAKDIEKIATKINNAQHFSTLNSEIDACVMTVYYNFDPLLTKHTKKRLDRISKRLKHFNKALQDWKKTEDELGVNDHSRFG